MHINSFAVKKDTISQIGGFPIGITLGEDIITIAQLYSLCDFAYSKQPTSIYYLTPNAGKSPRPQLLKNPVDKMFHDLLKTAKHRKNIKLYISSWHKRKVVGAILNKKFHVAIYHFLIALYFAPFYKKLYTGTIISIYCLITKKSIYNKK